MRAIAIAGAMFALLMAAVVTIPRLMRPGIPPSHFRQLPPVVVADLNRRGCNIFGEKNVLSADFTGAGSTGWAVLCRQGSVASLLIYPHPGDEAVVLNMHGSGLVDDPEAARTIRIASPEAVAKHNPGFLPGAFKGACVDDGVGMGSSIYCYEKGLWLTLRGAD